MNVALLMLIIFVLLLMIGIPVGFVVGVASLSALLVLNIPIHVFAQRFFTAVDSFSLMAIPLFMVAGSLMSHGSLTKRIIDFALSLFGNVQGALSQVTAASGVVMGGISGSGVADTAAIGSLMFPEMKRNGYDEAYSAALIAASGSIGLIIPPSVALIIYGVTTQASIGDLFVSGIVPGVLIGLAFMVYSYIYAKKHNLPKVGRKSRTEIWKQFKKSALSLVMPLIIIVGIRGGFFTPTEGGAVVSAYALIVSMFIHKDVKVKDLPKIFLDAALSTATIALIICSTSLLTWILAREQIPQQLSAALISITDNGVILVLLMEVILLITGMFIDSGPAIMFLAPILAPVAAGIGMDLVQFGLFMVINLTIGLLTPPVGTALYVSAGISKVKIGDISVKMIPFVIMMIIVSLMVAFVPGLWNILL